MGFRKNCSRYKKTVKDKYILYNIKTENPYLLLLLNFDLEYKKNANVGSMGTFHISFVMVFRTFVQIFSSMRIVTMHF